MFFGTLAVQTETLITSIYGPPLAIRTLKMYLIYCSIDSKITCFVLWQVYGSLNINQKDPFIGFENNQIHFLVEIGTDRNGTRLKWTENCTRMFSKT